MKMFVFVGLFACGLLSLSEASAAPLRVALSYDDGFKDHAEIVAPLLEKYGLRGTFNLVTDNIGVKTQSMTWDDARKLVRNGHDLASHTASHPDLVKLLAEGRTNEVIRQIVASRDIIEAETRSARPDGSKLKLFCHPYVSWNDAVQRLVRDAGLVPMTIFRYNFGNLGKGDACYDGRWMTTAEFLDTMIAEGRTDVDVLVHGVREGHGWEAFKTVADFERHLATIARYRDEGKIEVVLERDLRRYPGSIIVTPKGPCPEEVERLIRWARADGDKGPWTVIVRRGAYAPGSLDFAPRGSEVAGQGISWVFEEGVRFISPAVRKK